MPDPGEVVIVSDDPGRKKRRRKKTDQAAKMAEKRGNFISDETARTLLRWIKGEKELPETLVMGSVADMQTSSGREQDLQQELAEAIRERLRPWLWSFSVHACILIVMALIFIPAKEQSTLEILSGFGRETLDHLHGDLFGSDSDQRDTVITPQELPPTESTQLTPREAELAEHGSEIAAEKPLDRPPGLSLGTREPGSAANHLGAGRGGQNQEDLVVLAGLRWLQQVQRANGSWSLTGPYRDKADRSKENPIAATAMALLAFQGYGATPDSKHPLLVEFSMTVRKGWDWLLTQQDDKGCFFREGIYYSHRFYTHGLCTIALCERLAMTGDETLREPARRAIDYCLKHQSHPSGGWRYYADRWSHESDISVTGWIVMALKSGEMAGLEVPSETYSKIMGFLDAMQRDEGSQYVYREEEPDIRLSMTAEALLCRILLGWRREDRRLQRGVEILADPKHQPRFDDHYMRNVYTWYYMSQTLHHYGGPAWEAWNAKVRESFPAHQEKNGVFLAGSWSPKSPVRDEWGQHYGRLYTTCLMLLVLETPYRHGRIFADP